MAEKKIKLPNVGEAQGTSESEKGKEIIECQTLLLQSTSILNHLSGYEPVFQDTRWVGFPLVSPFLSPDCVLSLSQTAVEYSAAPFPFSFPAPLCAQLIKFPALPKPRAHPQSVPWNELCLCIHCLPWISFPGKPDWLLLELYSPPSQCLALPSGTALISCVTIVLTDGIDVCLIISFLSVSLTKQWPLHNASSVTGQSLPLLWFLLQLYSNPTFPKQKQEFPLSIHPPPQNPLPVLICPSLFMPLRSHHWLRLRTQGSHWQFLPTFLWVFASPFPFHPDHISRSIPPLLHWGHKPESKPSLLPVWSFSGLSTLFSQSSKPPNTLLPEELSPEAAWSEHSLLTHFQWLFFVHSPDSLASHSRCFTIQLQLHFHSYLSTIPTAHFNFNHNFS